MIVFTIYQKFTEKKSCSKLAKFAGKLRIDLKMIFLVPEFFCATFSFRDMANGRFLVNMVDFDVCDLTYAKD